MAMPGEGQWMPPPRGSSMPIVDGEAKGKLCWHWQDFME